VSYTFSVSTVAFDCLSSKRRAIYL